MAKTGRVVATFRSGKVRYPCPQCGKIKEVQADTYAGNGKTKCKSCAPSRVRPSTQAYPHPPGSTSKIRQKAYNAVERCTNPAHPKYKHYAGRGIKVYAPWLERMELFVAYLMSLPGWDDNSLRLDREDNDKGYEPGNLRFVTVSESMKNRRRWGKSRSTQLRKRKEAADADRLRG